MPANVEGMVREAIRAIKAGNKAEARALLEKATEINQYNEQAWMWLSAAVDTVEEQILCLENVIYINPDNVNAQRGLEKLHQQNGTSPSAPAPAHEEPSFSTEPAYEQPLFEPETPDQSSAPAFAGFDLDGLNSNGAAFDDDAHSLFADDSPDSLEIHSFDDQLSFDEAEDDEPEISLDERVGGSSVFTADVDDMFGEDLFSDDDFSSAAIEEPENDLDDFFAQPQAKQPAPASGAPAFSGGIDDIDDEAGFDLSQDSGTAQAAAFDSSSDFEREFEDELAAAVDDTTRYFNMIPAEIKATRIPGIDETYPRALVIVLGVLALLNVGGLILLILNLA